MPRASTSVESIRSMPVMGSPEDSPACQLRISEERPRRRECRCRGEVGSPRRGCKSVSWTPRVSGGPLSYPDEWDDVVCEDARHGAEESKDRDEA